MSWHATNELALSAKAALPSLLAAMHGWAPTKALLGSALLTGVSAGRKVLSAQTLVLLSGQCSKLG